MIVELLDSYLKTLTVTATISDFLNKIECEDRNFKAVLHINKEAIEEAQKLDLYVSENNKLKGRLHGVPFGQGKYENKRFVADKLWFFSSKRLLCGCGCRCD